MRVFVILSVLVLLSSGCSDDGSNKGGMSGASDPSPNGVGGSGAGAASPRGAGASGAQTGVGTAGRSGAAGSPVEVPDAAAADGGGAGLGGSSGSGGGGAGGSTGAGAAGMLAAGSGGRAEAGSGGAAAGSGGGAGTAAGGSGGAAGAGGPSGGDVPTPVLRVPLRIHTAASRLTEAQLTPILAEMNEIWLKQAGICFEIEVTDDEANISNGIDLRYTAGNIPGASGANGLAAGQHEVWVIDSPNLGNAPNPVRSPTARTSAHEVGHVLNLAHQNPPPSTDCARPCHCAVQEDYDCDDFLMRSGRAGFFLSPDEIAIARRRAMQLAMSDRGPTSCSAPRFMP